MICPTIIPRSKYFIKTGTSGAFYFTLSDLKKRWIEAMAAFIFNGRCRKSGGGMSLGTKLADENIPTDYKPFLWVFLKPKAV